MTRRTGWLVVLIASLVLSVIGGTQIWSASAGDDTGTIRLADARLDRDRLADDRRHLPAARDPRPAVSRTAPEVPRRPTTTGPVAEAGAVLPTRLRVGSVGLDAAVDPVGVRADGLMAIPDDGSRAGWYRFGAAPGQAHGSVVLAGHVDTHKGLGAMAALNDAAVGDQVEVVLSDGGTLGYEIIGRETIPKDELPVGELFDRGGPHRLTLVTCGGPWRDDTDGYRDNVVVVAVPSDE